jgi:hypothetical protein
LPGRSTKNQSHGVSLSKGRCTRSLVESLGVPRRHEVEDRPLWILES